MASKTTLCLYSYGAFKIERLFGEVVLKGLTDLLSQGQHCVRSRQSCVIKQWELQQRCISHNQLIKQVNQKWRWCVRRETFLWRLNHATMKLWHEHFGHASIQIFTTVIVTAHCKSTGQAKSWIHLFIQSAFFIFMTIYTHLVMFQCLFFFFKFDPIRAERIRRYQVLSCVNKKKKTLLKDIQTHSTQLLMLLLITL